MREEKIYTIPIHDAFDEAGACPLCRLRAKREAELLEYHLGPSLMEAEVRLRTNAKGFCREHFTAMYESRKNRLGLALMLHTHLEEVHRRLDPEHHLKYVPKKSFFSGKKGEQLGGFLSRLGETTCSCVICEGIGETMEHYLANVLWLYFHEAGFREQVLLRSEICLPHLADLLRRASELLSVREMASFTEDMAGIIEREFGSLEHDLKYFTEKFDYRNREKPWGKSKSASLRCADFLRGSADGKPREESRDITGGESPGAEAGAE